jgi:hypothetical protein
MDLDPHLLDLGVGTAVRFAGQRPVKPDPELLTPG